MTSFIDDPLGNLWLFDDKYGITNENGRQVIVDLYGLNSSMYKSLTTVSRFSKTATTNNVDERKKCELLIFNNNLTKNDEKTVATTTIRVKNKCVSNNFASTSIDLPDDGGRREPHRELQALAIDF